MRVIKLMTLKDKEEGHTEAEVARSQSSVGLLCTFSFSVLLYMLGINLFLLSKAFVNIGIFRRCRRSRRVCWLGIASFLQQQLEGNHSGNVLSQPSSPHVGRGIL